MKLTPFTFIGLVASVGLMAAQAWALSEDDKSMNSPDGTVRFSDPDDKTPSAINLTGKAATGGVDPSSVRYDYDPASGSYVPHKN